MRKRCLIPKKHNSISKVSFRLSENLLTVKGTFILVFMIEVLELLQKIEKNSGMYLGRQSVSDLFMFIAGYEFARSQINEELTQEEEDFYNEFQPWLQQKLGVRSVTSWAKLIMLSCHDEKTGFEMFFKLLREFQVRDQVKQAVTA